MHNLSKLDIAIVMFDKLIKSILPDETSENTSINFKFNNSEDINLSDTDKLLSTKLMRVNHSGEICAQALYYGQALWTSNGDMQNYFLHAAAEEQQHLTWCATRIKQLGGKTSYLNGVWFLGSTFIASLAALSGDKISLGFVVATENQVEKHLNKHMHLLPQKDKCSQAIISQMCEDEKQHAQQAYNHGAKILPNTIQKIMHYTAKIMTTVSFRI